MESAEQFAYRIDTLGMSAQARIITERDNATRLALLDELRAMASEERFDIIQSNAICYVASELRAKYETQPAQPSGEKL